MTNKLTIASLIFLGFFTVFCSANSCGGTKTHYAKFVNPPSDSKIWAEDFVVWPDLPIRVKANGTMKPILTEDARRAADFWNSAIGCKVFEVSTHPDSEVQINITPRPEDTNWAASHIHKPRKRSNGFFWGSNVNVHVLYIEDTELRTQIMAHELGHALGLDDLVKNSGLLMYWKAGDGMKVHLEALSTLKEIYCGG